VTTISGPTGDVHSIGFVSDTTVMTSSSNGSSRMWEFDVDRAVERLCAGDPMTRAGWDGYFAGVEFDPPCG
jgi:hypothetical protein